VACLADNDARLALLPNDPFQVQTKPHGHGDVHMLLHSSGLADKWLADGFKWVCFFQDTNGLVFRALPAAIGVSVANDYDVNSLAVPRRAKEAIGAITRLTYPDGRCASCLAHSAMLVAWCVRCLGAGWQSPAAAMALLDKHPCSLALQARWAA
jgi:hypothetical protein